MIKKQKSRGEFFLRGFFILIDQLLLFFNGVLRVAIEKENVDAAQNADANQQHNGKRAQTASLLGKYNTALCKQENCSQQEKKDREEKNRQELFQDRITLFNGSRASITPRKEIEKSSFLTIL